MIGCCRPLPQDQLGQGLRSASKLVPELQIGQLKKIGIRNAVCNAVQMRRDAIACRIAGRKYVHVPLATETLEEEMLRLAPSLTLTSRGNTGEPARACTVI